MNIAVRGKNIDITPALRDYVEKRVSKVTKYFSEVGNIHAILSVEKNQHCVEVTVPVNGIILRAQEITGDMYSSVDLVVDKIERQITKYKTKLMKRFRSGADRFRSELVPDSAAVEDEFKVLKTKRFAIRPMSAEEAIMQMNLINHSFFVYFDADDESISIVYKRKDGNYGLLLPEFK
ncbi:MAG: ribosome-associated translation inhibitor RaiA [Acidaminococcales bacterium]|jgi:putative sigma-54 modulation protein|nr:ribosome-associated translation inhibitor RaiA [Acidaminococcales bacterium]